MKLLERVKGNMLIFPILVGMKVDFEFAHQISEMFVIVMKWRNLNSSFRASVMNVYYYMFTSFVV